jgi:SAM-dependent methyltransferase
MTQNQSFIWRAAAVWRQWQEKFIRLGYAGWPPVGWVSWGTFGRTTPVNRSFGFYRGKPIDRFYIERFLDRHAEDICGRVLEVGDRGYTLRFGGDRVKQSDVLHAEPGSREATIVGRLDTGEGIPLAAFDCAIITQTLHVIFNIRAAVQNLHDLLRPGGVALVTIPCVSQISRFDAERWGDYWRLTPAAAQKMFADIFPGGHVEVGAFGNVMLAAAFLHGLVVEDLPAQALEEHDPQYPILVCVRAVRSA